MSTLLIHESPLMVLPSLAVAVGLNEAIVLQQVHYWITRADNPQATSTFVGRLKAGRRWIYNNYEDWRARNFPFWSVSTIRRAIRSLENRELLISEVETDITCPGGKRKWYTINYDKLAEIESVQNDQTVYSTWTDPSGQNEQAYNIETETTSETTQKESLAPAQAQAQPPAPKPKRKRAPVPIKTLADLDQLHRVVAINAHRIRNGQGLNGRTMTRINMAAKDLRERFTDVPVEPDELARAYKWHCAQDGAPAAPKDSVKICDMVQAYRDAHPFKLSSNGALGPADPDCPMCDGKGVYSYDVPYGDPRFGKTEVCACRKPGTQEAAA